jgi:hypothetical protein
MSCGIFLKCNKKDILNVNIDYKIVLKGARAKSKLQQTNWQINQVPLRIGIHEFGSSKL